MNCTVGYSVGAELGQKFKWFLLVVSHAFHSSDMVSVLELFTELSFVQLYRKLKFTAASWYHSDIKPN
jgi:hypothetical protein